MNPFIKKFYFIFFILVYSSNVFAVSETQIKAVFLEKFTHLIEWPQEVNGKFVVCVYQDHELSKALEEIYKLKTFKSKPVDIINIEKKGDIPQCHLFFIGKDAKDVNTIIADLKTRSILTMSDDKKNMTEMVMITMFLEKNRFKYIINNKAALNADIKISHLLLRSAQEVIK